MGRLGDGADTMTNVPLPARIGTGGGLNQPATVADRVLTTLQEIPLAYQQNSLRLGKRIASAEIVKARKVVAETSPAMCEIVAQKVACAPCDDGQIVWGRQKIDSGPLVLHDAVVLVVSDDSAATLAENETPENFVSDACGHGKVIAHTPEAMVPLERAGERSQDRGGVVELGSEADSATFLDLCGKLRVWDGDLTVDQDTVDVVEATVKPC